MSCGIKTMVGFIAWWTGREKIKVIPKFQKMPTEMPLVFMAWQLITRLQGIPALLAWLRNLFYGLKNTAMTPFTKAIFNISKWTELLLSEMQLFLQHPTLDIRIKIPLYICWKH